MRPLQPIADFADRELLRTDRGVLEARLVDRYGSWCSICERAILDHAWAWDAGSQAMVPRSNVQLGDRSDLLLLCRNCQDAQTSTIWMSPVHLALPCWDITFSLDDGLLSYALEPGVEVATLDESGEPAGADSQSLVMVRACDPRGEATILRFGLNANYRHTLIASDPRLIDRRIELRTRAWRTATEFADVLDDPREPWAVRTLRTIESVGFLSVWLTVFDTVLGRAWINDWLAQPIARQVFRGTDWRRMAGPETERTPVS